MVPCPPTFAKLPVPALLRYRYMCSMVGAPAPRCPHHLAKPSRAYAVAITVPEYHGPLPLPPTAFACACIPVLEYSSTYHGSCPCPHCPLQNRRCLRCCDTGTMVAARAPTAPTAPNICKTSRACVIIAAIPVAAPAPTAPTAPTLRTSCVLAALSCSFGARSCGCLLLRMLLLLVNNYYYSFILLHIKIIKIINTT